MNDNSENYSSRMPRPWLIVALAAAVVIIGAVRFLKSEASRKKAADGPTAAAQVGKASESAAAAGTSRAGMEGPAGKETTGPANAAAGGLSVSGGRRAGVQDRQENIAVSNQPAVPAQPVALGEGASVAEAGGASLENARRLEQEGNLVEARNMCWDLLAAARDAGAAREIQDMLGRLNVELQLTPREAPEKTMYVVQNGDSLEKIARKFGTTVDLLVDGNDMSHPDLIKAGDRLLVTTGKFAIAISKSLNELTLTMDRRFFKRYAVATGKHGKTPSGDFVISEKQKEPVWWRPDGKEIPYGDPENILGTRWMSLRAVGDTPPVKGYGIHGTWDESMIGKAESAGCIRMKNADVEELFKFVAGGSPVSIRD